MVGCETSAAIARAGSDALVHEPSGLPVGPIVLPVIGPPSPPPPPVAGDDDWPHAMHPSKQMAPLMARLYYGPDLARRVLWLRAMLEIRDLQHVTGGVQQLVNITGSGDNPVWRYEDVPSAPARAVRNVAKRLPGPRPPGFLGTLGWLIRQL